MRDVLDPSPDLDNLTHNEDFILNGLMDMVVHLGGELEARSRWHFCCLLLPNYPASVLSLQQRGLVVRAQSEHSPYKVGITTVLPQDTPVGPSIRAFQSGHIIYLPRLSVENPGVTLRHTTRPTRSAIAVPVDGSDGISVAALYVAAETPEAFSEDDQRALRLIGCMVGELLETYTARLRSIGKLSDIITRPGAVDSLSRDFLSENEFTEHVEALLADVLTRKEHELNDVVSFIALDIDNQSSLANKYGDRMARDLSRAVGLRIQGQLRALKDYAECELYSINADRFYILLKGMSLEQAQAKAELLSKILRGSYQIDPQRMPVGQPTLPENMVTLSNITVRLGVSSYFYWKLKQILQRYAVDKAVIESRILLVRFLDELLDIGKREGGNVVVSWDPNTRTFIHVPRP
jgi:GGDEF domain-containing protein